MNVDPAGNPSAPEIDLQQLSVSRNGVSGCWSIAWRITNKGAGPLSLFAARLPHGQFKAEEQIFHPAIKLAPAQSGEFQSVVQCEQAPGLVTENAFVIFQVIWSGEPWRIFVRVRVVVNSNGEPNTKVELITTQQVGFSGVSC